MTGTLTVAEIVKRVRDRRRRKRCPECDTLVMIRGFRGEYAWTCPDCDALGMGYPTRKAALRDVRRRRG